MNAYQITIKIVTIRWKEDNNLEIIEIIPNPTFSESDLVQRGRVHKTYKPSSDQNYIFPKLPHFHKESLGLFVFLRGLK